MITATGTPAVDGNGGIVETAAVAFTTDGAGNFSQAVDYPGDYPAPYTTSQIRVILNGQVIDSPSGFGYAASIAASSWIGTPSTAGLVTMRVVYTADNNVGVGGVLIQVGLSQAAVVTATGVVAAGSAQPVLALTASDGTATFSLNPTSLLTPNTLVYEMDISGEQQPFFFTVPTVVDVFRGAYNSGTTYSAAGGSSNGDVVISAGVLYRFINVTPSAGHAPPNATYWQVVSGLPTDLITAYLQPGATTGTIAVTTNNLAHDTNVPPLADDPNQSPVSLHDDLGNLAARIPGNRRTITTGAAISNVTDDVVFCNAAGGAIAPTLATAVTRVRRLYFIATSAAHPTTITAHSGDTFVNGTTGTTVVLSTLGQWAVLESDGGTQWYVQTGTGGGGGGGSDATPAAVGVVEIDQSPASGHPRALTAPRMAAALGVAPLGGDVLLPSTFLTQPVGTIDEQGRWVKPGTTPTFAATQAWEGSAVVEPTWMVDGRFFKMWYRGGWTTTAVGYATCPITSDPTIPGNWTHYASNPILGQGTGVAGNAQQPTMRKVGGVYYLFYALSNWRLATSTDGITQTDQGVIYPTGGGVTQWANSSVVQTPDGTWYALVEGLTGGTWMIYLLSSPDGFTWSPAHSGALTSLQIHSGGAFGGPNLLPYPVDGLWHVYYHAVNAAANLPTNIYHATSPDLVNWTVIAPSPILSLSGSGFEIDQVADPDVLEAVGMGFMAYDGDNNGSSTASIGIAKYAGSLRSLINKAGVPLIMDAANLAPVANLPRATSSALGVAKFGTGLSVDGSGLVTAAAATGLFGPISNGTTSPLILNANKQIILSRRG